MFKRSSVIALGIVAGLSVVACGGGGGGGGTTIAPAPRASASASSGGSGGSASQAAAVAPATFTITIPNASASANSSKRNVKNIAANTQSVTFTLIQSSTAGASLNQSSPAYPLTTSSSYCTTVAAGLQCSIGINAVVGTDLYTVNTYSSTNAAAGTQVGSGAFKIVVAANQQNTASLTLSGTVASVFLSSNIPLQYSSYDGVEIETAQPISLLSLPNETVSGLQTSGRIYVIALDSSGNTILAPETYSSTIYVSLLALSSGGTAPASPHGKLSIAYDSGDGNAAAGTTVSTTSTTTTLPLYSPQDVITVSTNATDEYTSSYVSQYIIPYAGLTSTPPSSPPDTNAVLTVGIFPDASSPAPVPSPSVVPSPAPSLSPPPSTMVFTGLNYNTPVPSPSPTVPEPSTPPITIPISPDPTVAGLGSASGFYPSNVVSASLDLENFAVTNPSSDNTVSVYLSDTASSIPNISASTSCTSLPFFTGLTPVQQVGTGTGVEYFRFSFLDELPPGVESDACTITLIDSLGSQAVLEVYQNQNTLTVQSKGRKK